MSRIGNKIIELPANVNVIFEDGIFTAKCDNKEELPDLVDYLLNYDGPILCDFKVEPDLCLPLVAPGSSIDNMILHDDETITDFNNEGLLPPG